MNSRDSVEMLLTAVTYVSTYTIRSRALSCTYRFLHSINGICTTTDLICWKSFGEHAFSWEDLEKHRKKVPEMDVGLPYKLAYTAYTYKAKWPFYQNL